MKIRNVVTAALLVSATGLAAAPWRDQPGLDRCLSRPDACAVRLSDARVGAPLPAAFDRLDPMQWAGLPEPGPGQVYYVADDTVALVDGDTFKIIDLINQPG